MRFDQEVDAAPLILSTLNIINFTIDALENTVQAMQIDWPPCSRLHLLQFDRGHNTRRSFKVRLIAQVRLCDRDIVEIDFSELSVH